LTYSNKYINLVFFNFCLSDICGNTLAQRIYQEYVISWVYSCNITWFHGIIPVPSQTYLCSITWVLIIIPVPWNHVMVQKEVHEITCRYRNKSTKSRDGTGISPWNHVMVQKEVHEITCIINAELFLYHVILHSYFCTITWLYIFIPVRSCDFISVFLYCHVIIYTYSCVITWFFRITYVLSCDYKPQDATYLVNGHTSLYLITYIV
jgi:hypothetical protein